PDADPSRLDPFGRSVEALKGRVGAGSRGKILRFETGVKKQLPITLKVSPISSSNDNGSSLSYIYLRLTLS
ncbi:MAG: hypothetical protein ACREQA_08895, partial [Candidatus Binatia bacterium]